MTTSGDFPKYSDLMLPVLQAVDALGGSGSAREITAWVLESIGAAEEQLAVTYPNRPESVLVDRVDWARSYCKLAGALERPQRALYLLTALGKEILGLPELEARRRLADLDREVRSQRSARRRAVTSEPETVGVEDEDEAELSLNDALLRRLHRLSPEGFEEFCLYLLRRYGMELTRVGGTGDEGIDGIGTAPLSAVLSATVAVQAKRWDPSTSVSREKVALFQRDAAAAGAERAVMVTLGRFSGPARKAARQATPTVDLIDGERLCELIVEQGVGLTRSVDESWFDRFEEQR